MKFKSEDGRYFEIVEIESKPEHKSTWQERTAKYLWEVTLIFLVFGGGFTYFHFFPLEIQSNQPKLTEIR